MTQQTQTYTLEVSLTYSEPIIYRNLVVSKNITLSQLHSFFQISFGWDDSHLHIFNKSRNEPYDDEEQNEDISLEQWLGNHKKFFYTYDFGDNWELAVKVKKTKKEHQSITSLALCIGGENSNVIDDIGGISGFYYALSVLNDKNNPEYEDYLELFEDDFDSLKFDIQKLNKQFEELFN